jgi:hypothetical protein
MNAVAQRVAVVTGTAARIGAAIAARRIDVNVIWPGVVTTSRIKPLSGHEAHGTWRALRR